VQKSLKSDQISSVNNILKIENVCVLEKKKVTTKDEKKKFSFSQHRKSKREKSLGRPFPALEVLRHTYII
jgi:hypothetical protein